MFFSRSRRRNEKRQSSFKPSLCQLEDRLTPSHAMTAPTPGPATHLLVETPQSVKVGQTFSVEVEALSANNHVASGYTGTVAFSLGLTDAGAVLPANYTFTSSDHGVHFFNVTLTTAQSQTLTVTDTTTSTITGSSTFTVQAAPAATHFEIQMPQYVLAGGPITVTVIALTANGRVATGYAGTVGLTSTDGGASLPGNYTFAPGTDHGEHTFQLSFATTESESLTATDTTTSTITGTAKTTVEAANAVTHFAIFGIPLTIPGVPVDFVVSALDAKNHVVAGYTGTVTFSSSDSAATLPANYTFQASDDGKHTFTVTFGTSGEQSLTATDTVTASITGSENVFVFGQKFFFPFPIFSFGGSGGAPTPVPMFAGW